MDGAVGRSHNHFFAIADFTFYEFSFCNSQSAFNLLYGFLVLLFRHVEKILLSVISSALINSRQ